MENLLLLSNIIARYEKFPHTPRERISLNLQDSALLVSALEALKADCKQAGAANCYNAAHELEARIFELFNKINDKMIAKEAVNG